MQCGDIILVQGHGIISDGIEFLTHGGFSHSALVTSEDTIIEATSEGVIECPMHYTDRYAVFRVIGITDQKCSEVVACARTLVGKGYDYSQDAGFAVNALREFIGAKRIPNLFDEDNKLVCSATVDLSFRGAGIILRPDKAAGDITPVGISYSSLIYMIENHGLWEI